MNSYFDDDSPFEIAADLGKDLRNRRLSMNLTQETVAARSGVSLSTLKRIEAVGTGSLRDVISLAWTLGLPKAFKGLVAPAPPLSIDDIVEANARVGAPRRRASGKLR